MNRAMVHTIVSVPSSSIRGRAAMALMRLRRRYRIWCVRQPRFRLLPLSLLGAMTALCSLSASAAGISLLPNDPLEPFDNFGEAVAVDGNTMVIGKNGDNTQGLSAGAAYIYELDGSNNWVQVTKIFGDTGGNFDLFSDSVAIDGDVVAVGATSDDDVANAAGAVYVFERDAAVPEIGAARPS